MTLWKNDCLNSYYLGNKFFKKFFLSFKWKSKSNILIIFVTSEKILGHIKQNEEHNEIPGYYIKQHFKSLLFFPFQYTGFMHYSQKEFFLTRGFVF